MAIKFRQLHTKIVDSFDFNDMPDDGVRLTWVLLPIILDCEGRGIYSMPWIKSKMYPLREDLTLDEIQRRFDWLVEHEMITVYEVDGHKYFCIPESSWKKYQTGTNREAKSNLPPIAGKLPVNYRETSGNLPEAVGVLASASAIAVVNAIAFEFENAEFSELNEAFIEMTGIDDYSKSNAVEAFSEMVNMGATVTDMQQAFEEVRAGHVITTPKSLVKATQIVVNRNRKTLPDEAAQRKKYTEGKYAEFIET